MLHIEFMKFCQNHWYLLDSRQPTTNNYHRGTDRYNRQSAPTPDNQPDNPQEIQNRKNAADQVRL